MSTNTKPVEYKPFDPGLGLDSLAIGYDVGLNRPEPNQDFYWPYHDGSAISENQIDLADYVRAGRLYLVADGVSGGLDPQDASRRAAEAVGSYYYRNARDFPVESLLQPEVPASLMKQAILLAHQELLSESHKRRSELQPEQRTPTNFMQTTIACVVLRGQQMWTAHVGDSRVYLWQSSKLICLTKDQVDLDGNPSYLVGANLEDDKIGIQTPSDLFHNHNVGQLQPGDAILICSDGFYKFVGDKEIANLLRSVLAQSQQNSARVGPQLAREARARQGVSSDNITALLIPITPELASPESFEALKELAWRNPHHFDGYKPAYQRLGDAFWARVSENSTEHLPERDAPTGAGRALRLGSRQADFWRRWLVEIQEICPASEAAPRASFASPVTEVVSRREPVSSPDNLAATRHEALRALRLWPQHLHLARMAARIGISVVHQELEKKNFVEAIYVLADVSELIERQACSSDDRAAAESLRREINRICERKDFSANKDPLLVWLIDDVIENQHNKQRLEDIGQALGAKIDQSEFRCVIILATRIAKKSADQKTKEIAFHAYCISKVKDALRILAEMQGRECGGRDCYLLAREILYLRDSEWRDLPTPFIVQDLADLLDNLMALAYEADYVEKEGLDQQAARLERIARAAARLAGAGLIQINEEAWPDFREGRWQSEFTASLHVALFGKCPDSSNAGLLMRLCATEWKLIQLVKKGDVSHGSLRKELDQLGVESSDWPVVQELRKRLRDLFEKPRNGKSRGVDKPVGLGRSEPKPNRRWMTLLVVGVILILFSLCLWAVWRFIGPGRLLNFDQWLDFSDLKGLRRAIWMQA